MSIDLYDLREIAEMNFDYIESEGSDCVRFDLGTASVWVYESGDMDGDAGLMQNIQKFINLL